MAFLTGNNLLQSIIDSTGENLNGLIQATLSARLQQLIDSGTYSDLGAAIAISGFSSAIRGSQNIVTLKNMVTENVLLIEGEDDSTLISLSTTNPIQQATDGVAETFVYEIDSSNFALQSLEAGDIILQGFNVSEDKLVFDDVTNGTTSTASFSTDVLINSGVDTQINFDAVVLNNEDLVVAETGFSLTLTGVTDFSAVDFSVA